MSLTDLIDKLINEHGSFKEHLELLREQISMLEKENSALKSLREQISVLEKENSALKSENALLKGKGDTIESKLSKAKKEIEPLSEVIKAPKSDGEKRRLDAATEKVLKLFFDTGQELSVHQVAGKLSIDVGAAQTHFDLLSKVKLIVQTNTDDKSSGTDERTPALFELSYSGRKYVVENKIAT